MGGVPILPIAAATGGVILLAGAGAAAGVAAFAGGGGPPVEVMSGEFESPEEQGEEGGERDLTAGLDVEEFA